jgi:hypothetical protein
MMKERVLEAAILKFEAQRASAEANLHIYLERSAAVAEHPDVVEEVVGLTKQIAEADECILVLKEHAKKTPPTGTF